MIAENHLLFSIACVIFAKNSTLVPSFAQSDWWHIISSAVLTCLLPDIDHPKSFIGQRMKYISRPIASIFGHRGFTHSLLAYFMLLILFQLIILKKWTVFEFSEDTIQGMTLGYMSHILADMLTPAGVPLLWPCRWRFRFPVLALQKGNRLERILCITLLVFSIWMPKSLSETDIIRRSSQVINMLQLRYNQLISTKFKI